MRYSHELFAVLFFRNFFLSFIEKKFTNLYDILMHVDEYYCLIAEQNTTLSMHQRAFINGMMFNCICCRY